MKFSFFSGALKTPAVEVVKEGPYSVKKLTEFLNEWTAISFSDRSYAGDNQRRDELLKNIVEQIRELPEENVSESYKLANLGEIQIQTLKHEIYQQRKGSVQ